MAFLMNAWYAAAWSHEIRDKPFRRVLLNQPVVLFRKQNGEALAFTNICPHRFAPLHLGTVVNDAIECPYHGLRFNSEGVCVFNPDGDGRVPPGERLQRFPLLERYGTLWIWLGIDAADESKLPDFGFLTDPEHYKPVVGLIEVNADYRFVLDNLRTLASHFLTPETESRTHYFWSICRNFRLDDEEFDRQIRAGTEYAFVEQDEKMLRAIQEQVGGTDFWSRRPMLLHADQGPVRVRRALESLIAAESEPQRAATELTTA